MRTQQTRNCIPLFPHFSYSSLLPTSSSSSSSSLSDPPSSLYPHPLPSDTLSWGDETPRKDCSRNGRESVPEASADHSTLIIPP